MSRMESDDDDERERASGDGDGDGDGDGHIHEVINIVDKSLPTLWMQDVDGVEVVHVVIHFWLFGIHVLSKLHCQCKLAVS